MPPQTNNATGIAGVGYDGVTVMPVTVIGANGTGTDIDIIAGINWVAAQRDASGAPRFEVANMSLGGTGDSLTGLLAALGFPDPY